MQEQQDDLKIIDEGVDKDAVDGCQCTTGPIAVR